MNFSPCIIIEESYLQTFLHSLEQGRMEGELRYNTLMQLLLDAGRMDDLKKALSDEAYRRKLFAEFHL